MSDREETMRKIIGASDMEAEHKLLHDLLHDLKVELQAGRKDRIHELLGRFEDFARLHFMEEQSLMRLHAYPGYEAHTQEHDDLTDELRELSRRISDGELADAGEAARSLEEWFTKHMVTTDAALEKYLEEQGIQASAKKEP